MDIPSIIVMLGNLSRSLDSVERLVAGLAYVLGLFLMLEGLFKFKIAVESTARQGSGFWTPLFYILIGAGLIFLPSTLTILSNTTFGYSNVLQYTTVSNPYNIFQSIQILVQLAGLIWFVRGCTLLTMSTAPGEHDFGAKGLAFIVAGILAMNFSATMGAVNYILNKIIHYTLTVKIITGF